MQDKKQEKIKLRQAFLKIRSQIHTDEWQLKNTRICQKLTENLIFEQAKTVLAYFSTKNEPDISNLFTNSSHVWGFSRCIEKHMTWHQWRPGAILSTGLYGIKQPAENAPVITPHQVDLILLPCVACDRRGYRLGYGGGYYDRMFSNPAWQGITTIGITFDFAFVTELPIESWDYQLDYVCTETQLISTST